MQESNFILTKRNEKIKDPIVFGYSCIFVFKKIINWRIYGVAMYIAYENILTESTYDKGHFHGSKMNKFIFLATLNGSIHSII
jgi:hypothetical protein